MFIFVYVDPTVEARGTITLTFGYIDRCYV